MPDANSKSREGLLGKCVILVVGRSLRIARAAGGYQGHHSNREFCEWVKHFGRAFQIRVAKRDNALAGKRYMSGDLKV